MAAPGKTNSFGTFLETIEKAAPPEARAAEAPAAVPTPASALTDVSRRVLQLLATGPATSAQLRAVAGAETDEVLAQLTANGFVEKLPGRTVRYALTAPGQAVVQLLSA
jgi:chromosome segregation and condensation protein ScpB